MFDPFGDFDQRGYLRNIRGCRDLEEVRRLENQSFKRNFQKAILHLKKTKDITYIDFLKTHQILFGDFYPWAGQDRATVLPNNAVNKGRVMFSHPSSARLAVEYGLSIGQDKERMKKNCGEVMGNFAYGHPFLDGNGRTMLMVHMELCHRAGFSIAWEKTTRKDYLTSLTLEIESPDKGYLDHYLNLFKQPSSEPSKWTE